MRWPIGALRMPSPSICEVYELGLVPYLAAREIQEQLTTGIAAGRRPPALLLLEHPATFTFGRRAGQDDLLWSEAELLRRGVETHWIDRGGEATFHGPGQLVGYPLLSLGAVSDGEASAIDYTGYLRRLEETIVRALALLGVPAGQISGRTGVWVQPDVASRCPRCPPAARRAPAKLASIGVRVDARGVTRHGFALNVDPEMSLWDGIVACGDPGQVSISLAQLMDSPPSLPSVRRTIVETFGTVFGFTMIARSADELIGLVAAGPPPGTTP